MVFVAHIDYRVAGVANGFVICDMSGRSKADPMQEENTLFRPVGCDGVGFLILFVIEFDIFRGTITRCKAKDGPK